MVRILTINGEREVERYTGTQVPVSSKTSCACALFEKGLTLQQIADEVGLTLSQIEDVLYRTTVESLKRRP